jgi:hypothetical protein
MSLAYQSSSDPRAASWFLAKREEARLLAAIMQRFERFF